MWCNYLWGDDFFPAKLSKKKWAQLQNNAEARRYFVKFYNLFVNEFEWEGDIPDTIDSRWIEHCLLTNGSMTVFEQDGGYMALGSTPTGLLNPYGEPLAAWVYGMNGFNRQVSLYTPGSEKLRALRNAERGMQYGPYEGVLCRDNRAMFPYIDYLRAAAVRCANAMRACDVSVENMKVPFFILADEKQVNTIKEVLKQREENLPAILSNKNLGLGTFEVFPTTSNPEILKTFMEYEEEVENKLLELGGLNVEAVSNKKERLLVDEVNANNEEINMNADVRLAEREIFCERLEKAFGLKWRVKRRKEEQYVDGQGVQGIDVVPGGDREDW